MPIWYEQLGPVEKSKLFDSLMLFVHEVGHVVIRQLPSKYDAVELIVMNGPNAFQTDHYRGVTFKETLYEAWIGQGFSADEDLEDKDE